jgi:hypothetical protein
MRRSLGESEVRFRSLIGYGALALLPPLLVLVVLAAKFQGLQSPVAMDQAQVARNLARGEGFSTRLIRPLSLVFHTRLQRHPDLYNAPAYPFVLSLAYRLRHPSDKVTAGVGGGLWILSVWLTFALARLWLGPGRAALAACFYGSHVGMLMTSLQGLPPPLMALGLLLILAFLFPYHRQIEEEDSDWREIEEDSDWPWWGLLMAGIGGGLVTLIHYLLGLFALVVGLFVVAWHRRAPGEEGDRPSAVRRLPPWLRAGGWYLLGFLLPLLPWMGRSVLLTGSPVFSLYGYEVLAHTDTYPGETVWRTASPPPSPLYFLVRHPVQILRKVLRGFHQFWTAVPGLLNPVIGFLFLAALMGKTGDPYWRRLLGIVGVSLAVCGAGSCLFRPEPGLLLAWEPLLAIIAAGYLGDWIWERFRSRRSRAGEVSFLKPGGSLAYVAAVGLVAFPLFFFVTLERPGPPPPAPGMVASLPRLLSESATILTDQPAWVAWYADRRAVGLFRHEEEWRRVERSVGPLDATYVTQGVAQIPAEERSDWWGWLAAPQGRYRQLVPVEPAPPQAVLRVRAD